jgi:hypothetical protein
MSHLVLLDSEAVQALRDPSHAKHRRVIGYVQVIADRKRRAAAISAVVPTAVRVEAGWDRTSPAWAFPNQLRIADMPLDTISANRAATIRGRTRVSVADAHLGAIATSSSITNITVITSDPGDMQQIVEGARVNIVTI